MTERVITAFDNLVKWAKKYKCCGRRFKRKLRRMLRMNYWDIDHKPNEEQQ